MDMPLNGANGGEVHSPREKGFPLLKPLTYTTLILDLGDVLAYYSSKSLCLSVDPSQLKYILSCSEWFQHERGQLAREECFKLIEQSFGVTPENLQKTLLQLAATLTYHQGLIDLIRYLKEAADGDLKVYLATNITEDDWKILGPPVKSWGIFDAIFTSFELGVRKPEQGMYRHILKATNTDPESALFIDDKPENLATAQMLGIRGIHCDDPENVIRQLKNLFGDPAARGHAWLRQHAKDMWSVSNTGIVIHEQFAQLLLLEITKDINLVTTSDTNRRTWNTFVGEPVLTTKTYPDDMDTTTLALLSLGKEIPQDTIESVMDEMLDNRTEDGLFYTYFDKSRPRIDTVISANITRLFYAHNRGHQIQRTVEQLIAIARNRAYEFGMRYYYHPDWFFFYLAELCSKHCPEAHYINGNGNGHCNGNGVGTSANRHPELVELRSILTERLRERMGGHAGEFVDSWSAALRLSASQALGLENQEDAEILRRTQQSDGSWSKDSWIYRYGNGILFGNAGLVTALAVRGLKRLNHGLPN